jgi:hypothetical protein
MRESRTGTVRASAVKLPLGSVPYPVLLEEFVMSSRSLMLENLESRRCLAGNVSVSLANGDLKIVGDAAANWIEVRQIPGAGGLGHTFVVEGKAFAGGFNSEGDPVNTGAETRINGALKEVTLTTSQDTVRIFTAAGNDVVHIESAIGTTTTFRGLTINTGDGRDLVELQRASVYGAAAAVITTGAADEAFGDTVDLQNVSVPNADLRVNTGGGNDRVFAESVRVGGYASFQLGNGGDVFTGQSLTMKGATINMGASTHHDFVKVDLSRFTNLNVQLGAGDDFANLAEKVQVTNRLTVNGAAGDDTLNLGEAVTFGQISKLSVERTT